ncbi:uncharacterized protein LOC134480309 [Rattus norvegicus]|uniref:uncharacterized protein LOC134480309 n=1 Tax=Rattus norvegicus TaxID=10116 RepID=UPI002FD8682E
MMSMVSYIPWKPLSSWDKNFLYRAREVIGPAVPVPAPVATPAATRNGTTCSALLCWTGICQKLELVEILCHVLLLVQERNTSVQTPPDQLAGMLQVHRRVPDGDLNFQMLVSGIAFASSNDVIWSPEHLLSRQRSSISSIHFMLQSHHISHKRQILSTLFHLSLLSSLFLLSFSPTSLHPLAFVSTIPINLSTWSPVGLLWFVQT